MIAFNYTRAAFRLIGLFSYTFYTLMLVTYHTKRGASQQKMLRVRRRWAEGMMRILGFRITVTGEFPEDEPCLFVSNHRSALDPIVMLSLLKAFPVSRAEVRNWPLVGKGGHMTGIIFVDKSNKESRAQTRVILLNELRKGHSVLIYPEGQTNVAPTTGTFQNGSFAQAAAGGFRVIPHVIEYKEKEDYWDHTDGFAMYFIKRFGKRITPIRIAFGPPQQSDNAWTLMRNSQQWIDETILEVRKEWEEKK